MGINLIYSQGERWDRVTSLQSCVEFVTVRELKLFLGPGQSQNEDKEIYLASMSQGIDHQPNEID